MIEIVKVKASSQYRQFDWAVKFAGKEVYRSRSLVEVRFVARSIEAGL